MASRRPPDTPRHPDAPRRPDAPRAGGSGGAAGTPIASDVAPKRRRTPARAALQPAAAPAAPRREEAPADIAPQARRAMIAEAAYLRAQARGFTPGYEVEDWLAAEAEIDALLRAGQGRLAQ